jgi:hypothetical protein
MTELKETFNLRDLERFAVSFMADFRFGPLKMMIFRTRSARNSCREPILTDLLSKKSWRTLSSGKVAEKGGEK